MEPHEGDDRYISITLYKEVVDTGLTIPCGNKFMKISSINMIDPSTFGTNATIIIQNPDGNLTATVNK